jgi:hypothetical protein
MDDILILLSLFPQQYQGSWLPAAPSPRLRTDPKPPRNHSRLARSTYLCKIIKGLYIFLVAFPTPLCRYQISDLTYTVVETNSSGLEQFSTQPFVSFTQSWTYTLRAITDLHIAICTPNYRELTDRASVWPVETLKFDVLPNLSLRSLRRGRPG